MQRPLIRPCAYNILILLFTIITTAVFISPLLLFHYLHCHKTVTTDKLLRASLFPGADELTTPLLRLTSILCLPLCRINKLGNTSLEDCCDPLYLWVISCFPHLIHVCITDNWQQTIFQIFSRKQQTHMYFMISQTTKHSQNFIKYYVGPTMSTEI